MEAKDLRIGNLIQLTEDWYKEHPNLYNTQKVIIVNDISAEHLADDIYYIAGYNTEDVEGIPLTEEWLEKLGFEKDAKGFWFVMGQFYEIRKIFNTFSYQGNLNYEPIKYVHQLQNMFYAMTGAELVLAVAPTCQ